MPESKQSALIYIPDISGFTKFVNQTEVEHSNHIISELLEIMIASNQLDMQLSEVEGDALLFYRFGDPPGLKEIVEQTETMFLKFHTHLRRYDNERVCNCGACTTASGLTLKFVAHAGIISTLTVREHTKLTGTPVILTHRLLKNNIEGHEYLLISNDYLKDLDETETDDKSWIEWKQGSSNYEEVGLVDYNHFSLKTLHSRVVDPEPPPPLKLGKNPVRASIEINSSVKDIHAITSDFMNKMALSGGGIKIEWEEKGVPKIGTEHTCIQAGGKVFHFETLGSSFQDDKAEYTESLKDDKFPFKNIILHYIMEKQANGKTLVTGEFYYEKVPIIGQLIEFIARPQMKKIVRQGLEELKAFCEANYPITKSTSQATA